MKHVWLTLAVFLLLTGSSLAQQSGGGGTGGGGGGATPGGPTNAVQVNAGSGNLGGSASWVIVSGEMESTSTGVWLANIPTEQTSGNWSWVVGVGDNTPDTKPDHTMIFGWNVNNEVPGAGSNGLSFESYCSLGTGCLAGAGGQSETYFSMDDGKGSAVRPLGFFQRKNDDDSPYMYVLTRADSWTSWDRDFTYPLFSLDDNDGVGGIRTFDSLVTSSITDGTMIVIGGNKALGISAAGNVEFGREGGVDLAPGGDGSGKVRVLTNHFSTTTGDIEDTSNDKVRLSLGAGDSARHLTIANTSNTVLFSIAGTDANPDYQFDTKGAGNFIINNSGNGVLRSYPHAVLGYNTGGVTSTTSNSCGTTDPSIAGSDVAGKVTVGATGGTSCTVTFGYSWTFAPACVANGVSYTRVTSTTSALVLTGTFAAGEVISYICIGGQ